jgi:hypothetical protein
VNCSWKVATPSTINALEGRAFKGPFLKLCESGFDSLLP